MDGAMATGRLALLYLALLLPNGTASAPRCCHNCCQIERSRGALG
jgi:hypothetical protein